MDERADQSKNPDPGHPHDETQAGENVTAGAAALRKGSVEVEGPKAAKSGGEGDRAGGPEKPQG